MIMVKETKSLVGTTNTMVGTAKTVVEKSNSMVEKTNTTVAKTNRTVGAANTMVGTTKTMVKIDRRRNANCPNDLPIVSDHGLIHFCHGLHVWDPGVGNEVHGFRA